MICSYHHSKVILPTTTPTEMGCCGGMGKFKAACVSASQKPVLNHASYNHTCGVGSGVGCQFKKNYFGMNTVTHKSGITLGSQCALTCVGSCFT